MNTIIRTEKLCKSYQAGSQQIPILKDIDIQIKEGEFVSIMGPSGSGKSTLLYLLGALDRPTSGRVVSGDKDLSTLTDSQASQYRRCRLGFVFQFYNLVPNLTAEENIMLPIWLDKKKPKHYKSKLEELLTVTDLKDKRRSIPAELSGGQQQRVAIARALIHDPDIILADEPIGNLDSVAGERIMKLLQQISVTFKKTVIQVTHSAESADCGDRVIYIRDGRAVS